MNIFTYYAYATSAETLPFETDILVGNILIPLDTSFSTWYSVFSDRVADTCEARDL